MSHKYLDLVQLRFDSPEQTALKQILTIIMFVVVSAAGQDTLVQSVTGRVATHELCHCTSVHNIGVFDFRSPCF